MNSCIYEGLVSHNRLAPHNHYFRYTLYMMYLDLAELPELFDTYPLWSSKRPALAWFRRKDHVGDSNVPLDKSVRQIIKKKQGKNILGLFDCYYPLTLFWLLYEPSKFLLLLE